MAHGWSARLGHPRVWLLGPLKMARKVASETELYFWPPYLSGDYSDHTGPGEQEAVAAQDYSDRPIEFQWGNGRWQMRCVED